MKPNDRTALQKITDNVELDNWSRFAAVMTIGTALIYWLFFG